MRIIKMVALGVTLVFACANRVVGQECESLRNEVQDDLTSFLNTVVPDPKNADCVTLAIRQLGTQRHTLAIPALVRLLDFRRPLDAKEKLGVHVRVHGVWEIYPAVEALESMGAKALPALQEAIVADSYSSTARENAVAAWMEIYRQSDEHPKAVALLKQAETNAKDAPSREKLKWAVQKALTWCNPPEIGACQQAAATGSY